MLTALTLGALIRARLRSWLVRWFARWTPPPEPRPLAVVLVPLPKAVEPPAPGGCRCPGCELRRAVARGQVFVQPDKGARA